MNPENRNLYILKIAKIVLIAIPVVILLFVANKRFVPFGKISETYSFKKPAVLISALIPENNTEGIEMNIASGKYYQRIAKDPVFFNVYLPFNAKFIDVELEYQNPEAPIVQLGAQKPVGKNNYLIETLENSDIDNSDWIRTDDLNRGVIFMQKPLDIGNTDQVKTENGQAQEVPGAKFSSYDDFLNDIPENENIALYQYDLLKDYKYNDYRPSNEKYYFDNSIRGSHDLLTYVGNENLDYTFYFKNRKKNNTYDNFLVSVYQGQELVKEFQSAANTGESGSDIQQLRVYLESPPEGIYRLKINANDDIDITKFETFQSIFGFQNRIFFSNSGQASHIYVKSPFLSFKTDHPEGVQTITVNDEKIKIENLHRYYSLTDLNDIQNVKIPKNDLIAEFNGIAALTPENLENLTLNAFMKEYNPNTGLQGFDYLVAKYYKPAQAINGWKTAKVTFNTDKLLINNEKIKFIISVPELKNYQEVKIGKIKVTLRK